METGFMNRTIGLVIALVVGGLLVGGLLIPTVQGMTEPTKTYENMGVPFALMDDNEHTMVIENVGGEPKYTVDGVVIEKNPEYLFNSQSTVIYGTDGFLRVWKVGGSVDRLRVQAEERININLNAGESATFTFDSTNITGNNQTVAIKPVAYLSNGSYSQLINPVVKDDSVIYIAGLTEQLTIGGNTNQFVGVCASGTLDDLTFTVADIGPTTPTVTVTDLDYTVSTTDLGNGLKKIDDITLTITWSDDGTSIVHYTYFIAPAEIVYDNPAYIGSTNAVIMGVVSLLGIVALVVVAANGIRNKY